jgi:knotted carbamoyltransferase YgeW
MKSTKQARQMVEKLEVSRLAELRGRSMLLTSDWSAADIECLLDVAEAFQALDQAGIATPLFPNELDYALFFDASTRTKSSWAGAAARLGSKPVIVDGSSTQVSHGETAEETGAMLGMNAHAMGIRHDLILGEGNTFMRDAKQGIDDYLAATGDQRVVPIVNLQCDIDHPTQALADLNWLRESFPEGVAGKTVAVTWAYSPSYAKPLSVPQGLVSVLPRFGMNVRLAHPEGYDLLPEVLETAAEGASASGGSFTLAESMDDAFAGADVVYPKSWGPYDLMLERVTANRAKDSERMKAIEAEALVRNLNHQDWICNERRMATTQNGSAIYMHCLPADIGDEVTQGVMDRARVDLAREANKKVYAIMALLAVAKAEDLRGQLVALL